MRRVRARDQRGNSIDERCVSFPLAFIAGVFSFLSPCVLPLVPSYVSFITGMSLERPPHRKHCGQEAGAESLISNSLCRSLAGFSAVFIALGCIIIRRGPDSIPSGVDEGHRGLIIIRPFHAGFLKLDFLMRERKVHLGGKPAGYIGTFAIGMTFAAGWTPCIGPSSLNPSVCCAKGSAVLWNQTPFRIFRSVHGAFLYLIACHKQLLKLFQKTPEAHAGNNDQQRHASDSIRRNNAL